MALDLTVLADPAAVAARTADVIAGALASGGSLALSGGSTPVAMYGLLADRALPWADIAVYQVDERLVGPADPARNWLAIESSLMSLTAAEPHPMPLDGGHYAVPDTFDVIHLGLGDDGHTASLVPGDPVLAVDDRDVATTQAYQGNRRLTLTARAINRADLIVWQVVGAGKHDALQRLLDGDTSIPAGLVRRHPNVLVIADEAVVGPRP